MGICEMEGEGSTVKIVLQSVLVLFAGSVMFTVGAVVVRGMAGEGGSMPRRAMEMLALLPTATMTATATPTSTPTATPTPEAVVVYGVGDVMLSRTVEDRMKAYGYDYPFTAIEEYFGEADMVVGNLETPLVEGPRVVPYQMSFRAPPESATVLAGVGFSMVSLANNHTFNQRRAGIFKTMETLDAAGVGHVGAGETLADATTLRVVEIKGVKLGFLGFAQPYLVPEVYQAGDGQPGLAILETSLLEDVVPAAAAKVDHLIVLVHWGNEYNHVPNGHQKSWGHQLVDLGADVVLGHHPHVIQSAECYADGIIFYSLGNFVFDQLEPATKVGAVAELVFRGNILESVGARAVRIHNLAQPRLVEEGRESERILQPLGEGWDECA